MACGSCGKNKMVYVYKYTDPQGKTTTYDSEVKARAAKIKNGGSYRKVAK
jgi:hypothetical protein